MSQPREDGESLTYPLSVNEKDAIGEIGNICMGTAATALSRILGNKVSITTPRVSIGSSANELENRRGHFVRVEISFLQGIEGSNVLFIREHDVLLITGKLMGESFDPDTQLNDMHISAISEVMNQMVGASSTALASIIKKTVNISPPVVARNAQQAIELQGIPSINVRFALEIENVLSSEFLYAMPYEFGKELSSFLLKEVLGVDEKPQEKTKESTQSIRPVASTPAPAGEDMQESRTGVRSMQYQLLDAMPGKTGESKENIQFIMDVPLQVTVELGQCKKTIKEILALSMGSVIVLDKLAGEMVDIFVNDKLFARGEVVVIDDNYGVRITDVMAESNTPQR